MRLIVEQIDKGLHPSEVLVAIKTAEGVQRLVVSARSLQKNSIPIGWPLGQRDDGATDHAQARNAHLSTNF
jgi:hypothetical protein